MSGVINKNNEYLNKDIESTRAYTKELKNTVFPDWIDDTDVNAGNFILDSQAFMKDVINFYIEKTYQELNITTAKTRRGIKNLANLGQYEERKPYASKTIVNLHCEVSAGAVFTLPKGSILKTGTENQKQFQTLTDGIFDTLTTDIDLEVENSLTTLESFESYGRIWENFILSRSPFLRIEEVEVDGEIFTQVDDFFNSNKDDKHFIININEELKAIIIFGNGTRGKRANNKVNVSYTYTFLEDGYIEQNSFINLVGNYQDTLFNPITVTVNSNQEATHSRLYETVNEIRFGSIKQISRNNRCFSRVDFEDIAYNVGGVARCLMLSADEVTGLGENKGTLFIVPVSGGLASETLINDVVLEIEANKPPIAFNLTVTGAIYKSLEIDVVLYFKNIAGLSAMQKAEQVFLDLQKFFNPLNENGTKNELIDFGYYFKSLSMTGKVEIPLSTIFNIIRDSNYVLKVNMQTSGLLVNGTHTDLTIEARDFPYFKRLKIIDGDTGEIYEYFN